MRSKRQSKIAEESYWDCSVCTYRNSAEAFKCLMCDVRKGTSTRKPRINPQLVAQQVVQQYTQPQPKVKKDVPIGPINNLPTTNNGLPNKLDTKKPHTTPETNGATTNSKSERKIRPKLKYVDRSKLHEEAVTVNNVTVIITEFQPKMRRPNHSATSPSSTTSSSSLHLAHSSASSPLSSGAENGHQSDSTNHSTDLHSDSRSS